jgi:THUMP domain-like/RNA cap guanine-N2 methyltransferase
VLQQPSPLLSAQGRALLDRLSGAGAGPEQALRLARVLRGSYPADLIAAGLSQQALRDAAKEKFSRADQMLFTRAGLEQASSELTARHSAARFTGAGLVADLCCGIGGNLTALAAEADVLAVDRDLTSLQFARHNASVYGAAGRIRMVCADVRDIPLAAASVAAVFIDPARRAGGRRLTGGRGEPPLDWCVGVAERVPSVGIKTAPGLPRELVPPGWEVEFVAEGRSLKQALLWSPALATTNRRATVLPGGNRLPACDPLAGAVTLASDTLAAGEGLATARTAVAVGAPGGYLLDPSPAVTRAGLVQELARQLGAWQIDPMIAFLSADRRLRTPFGRTLRVLESAPWHEKTFALRLRALGIGTADIRRRGLPGDVAQIRQRLKLRGPGTATIVITRMNGRPWGLICTADDGT